MLWQDFYKVTQVHAALVVALHVVTGPRPTGLYELRPVLSNERIQGLERVTVHGVRAGQAVRMTVTVPAGAELMLRETSFDPTLATGWVAPGDDVSLVQPRMEVSVAVPR